tara:strand:+ start:111 stop:353 length:243 start_codon:yes stop_codon:yes gene_type:complete
MKTEIKVFNSSFSRIIITFAFFYSSLICHFEAISQLNDGKIFLAIFLWVCALTAFMGGFRFQIAKIVKIFTDKKKNEKIK